MAGPLGHVNPDDSGWGGNWEGDRQGTPGVASTLSLRSIPPG